MAKRTRVFDSWALLAFLEDEPVADAVAELIAEAHESDGALLITTVKSALSRPAHHRVSPKGDDVASRWAASLPSMLERT